MSLFDRIFGRKVSPTNSDALRSSGDRSGPNISDVVPAAARVEAHQVVEEARTTTLAAPPESQVVEPPTLLPGLAQSDGGVVSSKEESSHWQVLPDEVLAQVAQSPSDPRLAVSPEPSVRELALLRVTIALREVLTERLFQDLASSKLEIARLCGETMDRIRVEAPSGEPSRVNSFEGNAQPGDAPESDSAQGDRTLLEQLKLRINELESENAEIRGKDSEGLSRVRLELSQQQQHLAEEKERLEKRLQEADMQSRRLAEREATVYKNFSELQRREERLAGFSPVRTDAVPRGGSDLTEEVRRLRAQIDSDASSSKKREATLVEEIRILRERVSSDANTAFKKQMAMQEQLDQADRSIQNLLKAKNELERTLEAVRRSGSPPQRKTKRESHLDSALIAVSDHRIIDWMLEEASPEQASVDHGYLSLTGDGPWADHQIRELMEGAGFSLWMMPDADVDHVVVGRQSWDVSALEQQIEAMEGRQLRIYSQEMWFAKLVTGRDPFDSGDHELLMAFARGHPALEYLIDRDAPWPEVSSGELVVGDGVFTEGIEFGVNSPLHNFGYQVGVSSGLSVAQRRALLARFLEAKDLAFDGDASAEYRSHWGRPRSVQRLFRVASHIRWLIGWQGKSPLRAQANEDWRGDLQWLKKTYYKPNLHKFRWPGV